jgi:hypothetical protein
MFGVELKLCSVNSNHVTACEPMLLAGDLLQSVAKHLSDTRPMTLVIMMQLAVIICRLKAPACVVRSLQPLCCQIAETSRQIGTFFTSKRAGNQLTSLLVVLLHRCLQIPRQFVKLGHGGRISFFTNHAITRHYTI